MMSTKGSYFVSGAAAYIQVYRKPGVAPAGEPIYRSKEG